MTATRGTFTLDRISMDRLKHAAKRLGTSKSEVVREAIMEFHGRNQLEDNDWPLSR